jgi:hypothetical protein
MRTESDEVRFLLSSLNRFPVINKNNITHYA